MQWITRERPKIDRIACPWLIKKFVDAAAVFIYVPFDQVLVEAAKRQAIPFDIPGVEYTHYKDQCTFDYIIKKHTIKDPAIAILADIVRGADTDQHSLARESAGLWAISAGLSFNFSDDLELLSKGMELYDALYSWATHLYQQKHLQNSPFENLLHDVYQKLLVAKASDKKKVPIWVKELKEMIQDQIDTSFSFNINTISNELQVNPSYLSREFSRYFDNLNFGEYIRKIRIEKAMELIDTSDYSLTEIAYLTGFSDQSHFTRIFKLHTGQNPSAYKKARQKSKQDTKGQ